MSFHQEPIFQWLAQYAYEPTMVYFAVVGMMLASGFGLPIPEEVTIVSVGLITFMGKHPDLFPPPFPGAPAVDGVEAAIVTLVAVIFADCLVFCLGRIFGRKLMSHRRFSKFFPENVINKINKWINKYGSMAAFIFRFTPGIRFPAHIILGMSELPAYKFVLVDGFAALISVPTQILLIYHYGEPILKILHRFKIGFLGVIGVVAIFFVVRKIWTVFFKQPLEKGISRSP